MRIQRAIALLCAAACTTEEVGSKLAPPLPTVSSPAVSMPDAGPARATEKERSVAKAYARALATPSFASLEGLLGDPVRASFGRSKTAVGAADVLALHETLFGAFDERKLTPRRVWLTDSSQAIEWTMTGVQAREWMGVAPTHKPAVIEGVTLVWTEDRGMISDVHILFDTGAIKAQLAGGPLPEQPAGPPELFEQTGLVEETRNVGTVRDSLEALEPDRRTGARILAAMDGGKAGKHDEEAQYLATMTNDVELWTHGAVERGPDPARRYLRLMRKAIGQLDALVLSAWGVSSFVVTEYTLSGAQLAPIGSIPFVRDRVVVLDTVDIVEMRDGRMARVRRYDNPDEIARR